ncbi:neutral/alkaline non-lysosomal ceramidase N-terminal domain-containing protein [bacterium]|nr:neutral/alkaline non-lysosomal ceramidase N-terminal domain-containing protein [bacterium]
MLKKSGTLWCFFALFLGIFLLCSRFVPEVYGAPKNVLSAGCAKVNITPRTPIPMSGYASRKDPFKGVHDELFARAVVFGDGEHKAAIITADIIGLSHDFWKKTTERIERETGIRQEYIMLCAVHNHGGPDTAVYTRNPAPGVIEYVRALEDSLVSAVKQASASLKPVSVGVGKGECLMNINRRARHPDGSIALGRNPYGPCDHEVGVVRIDDSRGNPVSILFNWPCHGTVLGPENYLITGDWPGSAERFVETKMGGNCVAPVTIGASGDINPIYGPHIDFEVVKWYSYGVDSIGMILGEEAMRVARETTPRPGGSISASQRVVSLPRKTDDSKLQQPDVGASDDLNVRLTVLKVGDIVFAGVSGELFNEIGTALKKQSPYAFTFVVTHCNGSSGYLITDKAYEEGGYEAKSTRVKAGAEKVLRENLLEMIHEL